MVMGEEGTRKATSMWSSITALAVTGYGTRK